MKKLSKKWLWLIIPLAILLPVQFLNHTGFCYGEMRYLSEQELIDRFLFRKAGDDMGFEEKVEAAKHRPYPGWASGIEYPSCCRIDKTNTGGFWRNFFGLYDSYLVYYFPRSQEAIQGSHDKSPYVDGGFYINACGKKSRDMGEIYTSKKVYDSATRHNLKKWKENQP